MKEYEAKKPVLVIGGSAGSFLGEYLAGGLIIVLGIDAEDLPVGNFIGTGMHGGKIFIRTNKCPKSLPSQVIAEIATDEDLKEIAEYVSEFSREFNMNENELINDRFYVLKPNAKNPYKQLYTMNL